jgi:hypothetical protein
LAFESRQTTQSSLLDALIAVTVAVEAATEEEEEEEEEENVAIVAFGRCAPHLRQTIREPKLRSLQLPHGQSPARAAIGMEDGAAKEKDDEEGALEKEDVATLTPLSTRFVPHLWHSGRNAKLTC